MTDEELFFGTSGPRDAKIVFIAESWGSEEARKRLPLVGQSGEEFTRILNAAGINRNEVLLTNVIAAQPQNNEMWRFFEPKAHWGNRDRVRGLAPTARIIDETQRLYRQIAFAPRTLIVAAGNWSLWALSNKTKAEVLRTSNNRKIPAELQTWAPTGIQTWRGSQLFVDPVRELLGQGQEDTELSRRLSGLKLLPIIHPAAILRQWELREVTIHDLKTRVPKALASDWRPRRETFFAPPTFFEAEGWLRGTLLRLFEAPTLLACDIETLFKSFIVCIGFADSPHFAISIPFVKRTADGNGTESYWTIEEEKTLFPLIAQVLSHPNLRLIGQNFLYDTQYIQKEFGIVPPLYHDTMLAQNVLFPGTPKALWYLASLYCDYYWYWKDEGKEWNWRKDSLEQLLQYNCMDVARTFEVAQSQQILLDHLGMQDQMALKRYIHGLCLRMMSRGVRFDTKRRGEAIAHFGEVIAALQRELLEIIPQDWCREKKKKTDAYWFSSALQTRDLFYSQLGFRTVLHKKTKQPTVGKEALEKLTTLYPHFTGLFQRLDTLGSVANSLNVITTPLEYDDRIRCSYNPAGTETHRLSSSENAFGRGTNLQNLTTGEEE